MLVGAVASRCVSSVICWVSNHTSQYHTPNQPPTCTPPGVCPSPGTRQRQQGCIPGLLSARITLAGTRLRVAALTVPLPVHAAGWRRWCQCPEERWWRGSNRAPQRWVLCYGLAMLSVCWCSRSAGCIPRRSRPSAGLDYLSHQPNFAPHYLYNKKRYVLAAVQHDVAGLLPVCESEAGCRDTCSCDQGRELAP